MQTYQDGPISSLFSPLAIEGNTTLDELKSRPGVSSRLAATVHEAARGDCTAWGIPFQIGNVVALDQTPLRVSIPPVQTRWLVFLHASDLMALEQAPGGLVPAFKGHGRLNEHAANYIIHYSDGSQEVVEIRRRHQIGPINRPWGENCFESVAQHRPFSRRASHEQVSSEWGWSQTRVESADHTPWDNWLWAWENPHPERTICALGFEPVSGLLVISAVSAGQVHEHPLRWQTRRKAIFSLPEGQQVAPSLDEHGLLAQIQLDLGQVISAQPQPLYPEAGWQASNNNQLPEMLSNQVLLEYSAHPEANFVLADGQTIPVASLETSQPESSLRPIAPSNQRVLLRVIDSQTRQPVAVKLHVHGQAGEYLAPLDRHRILNPAWYEDYSVDFSHRGIHPCSYISGETVLNLPLGKVYLEISKGFEIRPLRRVCKITPDCEMLEIEIEKTLAWRAKGWVTADTHVHFLSPVSALLEGAAEDVNVINLLASQWGELMTNVGDFDGKTTWGSREAGGDGEYLVRVGSENRQHVMGHISLLGYSGRLIVPMTSGGPDESALGDPVEVLLTEWARQCKAQGGLVVLPHFPNPRAEHAASIVEEQIDAVEMTSWGDLYAGIDPLSLSDWYRYLNCGYRVAAVGGTDKMSAATAVGTVRTYARVPDGLPFTYSAWMDAVRRAETFVTYGPLLEFSVDGRPMGSRIQLPPGGGTVQVEWQVASVTIPLSRVELIVNGEIRESLGVGPWQAAGSWKLKLERGAWIALLVRGHYPDQPEIITAHSSAVQVDVAGTQILAAADAVTILDQIEGSLAYLNTVAPRAEERIWKRMLLVLESARRSLHNRMHQNGFYHDHPALSDHGEHHPKR